MKIYLSIVVFFIGFIGNSQETIDEASVKTLVEDFFIAFHKQDTIALRAMANPMIQMQSISIKEGADSDLVTTEYSNFLKAIYAIPKTTEFQEKIHSFKVQVDRSMANVSAPYSFYVNGKLSHCGVNTFQLFKKKDVWKIIYIVDTRTKNGCETM